MCTNVPVISQALYTLGTAATTLLGAFDPFDEMADIAQAHDIWFHIDGAFGGSLILGSNHKQLFNGVERADSLAWNPHKLMNIPLICSSLLLKQRGTLQGNLTDLDTDSIVFLIICLMPPVLCQAVKYILGVRAEYLEMLLTDLTKGSRKNNFTF